VNRRRPLALAWSRHEGRDTLRIDGWSRPELDELSQLPAPELARRLVVLPTELVAAVSGLRGLQPVAGRFDFDRHGDGGCVHFSPRFPFAAGTSYSLLVAGPDGHLGADEGLSEGVGRDSEAWTIRRPARTGAPATTVVAICPTADELPVNQLKLYIYFSGPMSEGWAARAVQVRRADNDEPLDGVFLPAGPELWDSEHRRLTLLLDTGRIKRGLAAHQQTGYPLVEGVPIVVAVDPAFRDAEGRPLRTYRIGPPVRTRFTPADWSLGCPAAGSTEPLTVRFGRPLDRALLGHSLRVTDVAGRPVPGAASVGTGERSWQFTPGSPWQPGLYAVTVNPRLEDLAGNSLTRVFDRDLTRASDDPIAARPTVAFTCSPKTR